MTNFELLLGIGNGGGDVSRGGNRVPPRRKTVNYDMMSGGITEKPVIGSSIISNTRYVVDDPYSPAPASFLDTSNPPVLPPRSPGATLHRAATSRFKNIIADFRGKVDHVRNLNVEDPPQNRSSPAGGHRRSASQLTMSFLTSSSSPAGRLHPHIPALPQRDMIIAQSTGQSDLRTERNQLLLQCQQLKDTIKTFDLAHKREVKTWEERYRILEATREDEMSTVKREDLEIMSKLRQRMEVLMAKNRGLEEQIRQAGITPVATEVRISMSDLTSEENFQRVQEGLSSRGERINKLLSKLNGTAVDLHEMFELDLISREETRETTVLQSIPAGEETVEFTANLRKSSTILLKCDSGAEIQNDLIILNPQVHDTILTTTAAATKHINPGSLSTIPAISSSPPFVEAAVAAELDLKSPGNDFMKMMEQFGF